MKGLRILFHHRIRADDGQAAHVQELIAALVDSGHEVLECALVPKAGQRQNSLASGLWSGLRLPRTMIEVMEVWYNRSGSRRVIQQAREFRPHFIYERHALHCRVGINAARVLGVPLLLEVNSPMCEEMRALGKLIFPRLAQRNEREVLSAADRVLAVSEDLSARLIATGADSGHCRVIRNAAVPDRYRDLNGSDRHRIRQELDLPEEALLLGFIGYMRPWHRLDLVFPAMADERLADLHLLVIGEGPALRGLREQARALGLADRLHVRPPMTQAELPRWVSSFDIGAIFAINPYASPLKLFDYLAGGVAVLAPRQPNIEELLTDGVDARLFEPGEIDSLIANLVAMCQDRAELARIGAAGAELLTRKRWTWQANAERVIDIYRELVG